jgi:hypothetical protein
MIAELAVTSGLGSSRLDGYWMGFVLVRVRLCVNLCFLLDNNLCLLLDNNICLLLDITLYGHVLLNWDIGWFNLKFSRSK